MTSQIAGLEMQLKQHTSASKNAETELKNVKELCVKLDEQKDALMNEMKERDDYRCVVCTSLFIFIFRCTTNFCRNFSSRS